MKDELAGLVMVLSFFLSFIYILTRSTTAFYLLSFFDIFALGLVLYLYKKPKEWFFLGGFIVFAFFLAFVPREIGPATFIYLASFMIFLLALAVFRPKTVEGEVLLADSKWAVVKVSSGFLAGVPKGIYAAKSKRGIKKGDLVILEVKRKWGERELRILKRSS